TGTTKPRDGEPVRSGPVAAAKQECACHGLEANPSRQVLTRVSVTSKRYAGASTGGYWHVANAYVPSQTAGMGEHTEKNAQGSAGGGVGSEAAQVPQPSVPTETNEATQQPRENTTGQGSRRAEKKSPSVDWSAIRERAVGLLAGIVRWAGLIFALILVGHIIFVIGEANPDNSIVSWAADWS